MRANRGAVVQVELESLAWHEHATSSHVTWPGYDATGS